MLYVSVFGFKTTVEQIWTVVGSFLHLGARVYHSTKTMSEENDCFDLKMILTNPESMNFHVIMQPKL